MNERFRYQQTTGTKSEVEQTGDRTITNSYTNGRTTVGQRPKNTVTTTKKRKRFERDLPGKITLLLYIFQLQQN